MGKIKIGIVGYGNVGKGVKKSVEQNEDMELIAIFTRRNPEDLNIEDVKVVHYSKMKEYKDEIDVMILCNGSATDMPKQGPEIAKMFNTIDSFDTHTIIKDYYFKMDESAKSSNKISIISTGWDPGLFSMHRLLR